VEGKFGRLLSVIRYKYAQLISSLTNLGLSEIVWQSRVVHGPLIQNKLHPKQARSLIGKQQLRVMGSLRLSWVYAYAGVSRVEPGNPKPHTPRKLL
jgi:hypothetical protein